MKTIGIAVNAEKKGALELCTKIKDWLGKRDIQVADSLTTPIEELIKTSDMIISLGGDGMILWVVSHIKGETVPILGVNLGSLGFLTEVKEQEIFEELNGCLLDKPQTENRLMISCFAWSKKAKNERRFVALNDIVIGREGLTRLLQLEVFISGEKFTSFRGDGLIVSTPTGSTAYSLSAGGAVLHPKLQTLMITPICPHTLALRPIVLSADEKIVIRVRTDQPEEKALLTADGQENLEIDDSYTVEVTRASVPLVMVKSSKRNYLETLRENFKLPDIE